MKMNIVITVDVVENADPARVRNGVYDIVRDLSEGYTSDDAYAGTFKVEGISHTILPEE